MRWMQGLNWTGLGIAVAAWLAGCATPPPPPPPPAPVVLPPPPPPPVVQAPSVEQPKLVSAARSEREYRRDAASHLYSLNTERIWRGKLPPLLYAVGVLRFDVDRLGRVRHFNWMRAPSHAPEVMAEIERTVRAAEPYPAPLALGGQVTYTDVWLWHKSGRFQLDTLTEGQM